MMKISEMHHYNELGLFPGPKESEEDFKARIDLLEKWSKQLKTNDLTLQDLNYPLEFKNRMPETQLSESGKPIEEKFGILPTWVPAYYCDRGLPLLTGGMAVQFIEKETEPLKTFFQLKSVFQKQKKWIIYTADELIRHEMCHVARAPLNSVRYEETFAYSTSDSWLRRKIGGALNTPLDNQLIMLSLLMWMCATFLPTFLPTVQGWISLFYIPFPTLVILGLLRNVNIRKEIQSAMTKLKVHFPNDYEKILFRLSDEEVSKVSRMTVDQVLEWWKSLPGFRGDFLRSLYGAKD